MPGLPLRALAHSTHYTALCYERVVAHGLALYGFQLWYTIPLVVSQLLLDAVFLVARYDMMLMPSLGAFHFTRR